MRVGRALAGGLFIRLAALITLALLPLGMIAIYQTHSVIDEAARLSRVAILGRTERAALGERELLQHTKGAASALAAAILPLRDQTAACDAVMQAFLKGQANYSFAGFATANGDLVCSSKGVSGNIASAPFFQKALARETPVFGVGRSLNGDGGFELSLTIPVRDNDTLLGYLTLAIPNRLTSAFYTSSWESEGIRFATIDGDGVILSSSEPMAQAGLIMPQVPDRAELWALAGQTFFATSKSQEERFFAVSEIIPGQVAVVGSWPAEAAKMTTGAGGLAFTLAFPILMWLAGMAVGVFGLHRLVIRHLSALRIAMRRYALGEREQAQLELINPPREFAEAQQSFNRMVAILSKAEQRREIDLREKTVLLREIHHRVKNNLQLIASIMNMQARSARSEEARNVLAQLQRRVRGLAAIHRTLNTNPDVTTVDAAELITALAKEIGAMSLGANHPVAITTQLTSVQLNQDDAVNLSMLVAETLTNAVKYVSQSGDGQCVVAVVLDRLDDNDCRLEISNDLDPLDQQGREERKFSSGLGARLIRAFVAQLEGTDKTTETETRFTYEVIFPHRSGLVETATAEQKDTEDHADLRSTG
ncbi:sensor histidine kinase [Phaeobacter porticola]|uniref:histidine kinase n=1 Tax=Phaeobacter porticola TaxID=1844006 RepID=A0A1L3I798_9RHOB|nr:sensor histidine kinase [Phaeobacter porticola]APG48029.1 putative signal transduction histidine kinase [Phaeobacter porticola]